MSPKPSCKPSMNRKDRAPRKSADAPPPETTTPAIIRSTLADVCGYDLKVCSKEKVLQVNTTAKRLYSNGEKAGKSADEIAETIRYVAGYFAKNDWRGKKGDLPAPKDIVDIWGAAIKSRNVNGHAGPVAPTKADLPDTPIKKIDISAARRARGQTDDTA